LYVFIFASLPLPAFSYPDFYDGFTGQGIS